VTQSHNDRFTTEHAVGQHNIQKWGLDIHNPVFAVSTLLILCFVIGTLLYPESAKQVFDNSKAWSIEHFDWLFMLSANIMVVFCLALIILPVGGIRIGGDKANPEFSLLSWFSMLFAAGMGIGLMYWSVAEPVAYYTEWYGSPFNVAGHTQEAASLAMGATLFHWGLHPWAIYAVVGLSLAYMTYNRNLPLTIRSRDFSAASMETSRSRTFLSFCAQSPAMPHPMVPPPRTAIELISLVMARTLL